MDRDQLSPPQHTPKWFSSPLCSLLSVSKFLLGGCQEEPGFMLVEIFIQEVVLSRCHCTLQALMQHFTPSKPPNCPNAASPAWKTCHILIREKLQESDCFSAKNSR